MREKAAAAWRSQSLNRAVRGYPSVAETGLGSGNRGRSIAEEEADGPGSWTYTEGSDYFEETDLLLDMENGRLEFPAESDCDDETKSMYRFSGRLSNVTVRRVLFALGFICVCGMLPALRMHGLFKRQPSAG
jgi:hypothetical protein